MIKKNYWLNLFTGATWDEFRKAGSNITGFRESRWNLLQKIKPGDYLICYLTGVSRLIGILEVTGKSFRDKSVIWSDENFPCRIKVKPVVELTPNTSIPIQNLKDDLSIFKDLKNPHAWSGHVRSSPAKWKKSDGEIIVKVLLDAQKNPTKRPVDKNKLKYRPKAIKAKIGSVTVPDTNEIPETKSKNDSKPTEHTKIQWLLLKLGSDMGFSIWAARNDKNKTYKGCNFSEIPRAISELPLQFDDATNKTIELIDVLWLKGSAIVAAFEIESTTSKASCI